MNRSLDSLALRKQLLQARSTLCRLRLRDEFNAMRDASSWARAAVMAVRARPVCSAVVMGLVLYGVAHSRLARVLSLAARILFLARSASVAINLLRKPSVLPPSVREPTDHVVADL